MLKKMRGLRSAQCNVVKNLCCSCPQATLAHAAKQAQAEDGDCERHHHERVWNAQPDQPAADLSILIRKNGCSDADGRLFRTIPACAGGYVMKRLALFRLIKKKLQVNF